MSKTIESLNNATSTFLEQHAKSTKDVGWSTPWRFKGEIPNQAKQGVYAFLNTDQEVVYIGVGASKGDGIYEGAGLGRRLGRVWKKHAITPTDKDGVKLYEPTDRYKYLDSVITLALDPKEWYLAYALEYYLISELRPEKNKLGK